MRETPDYWVIVKITLLNQTPPTPPIYKVFASWVGSYMNGDAWKINSGITTTSETSTHYIFKGYSGSEYKCRKGNYGTGTSYTSGVLENAISKSKSVGYEMEVLPEDYEFNTIV